MNERGLCEFGDLEIDVCQNVLQSKKKKMIHSPYFLFGFFLEWKLKHRVWF